MTLPLDSEQRQQALDPLKSICVTAPAGSGKTELLSQRVLQLLAQVEQPEEILAITFTRKAAAEMHLRIMSALRLAKNSEQPEEPHRRATWELARAALKRDQQCGWQLLYNSGRLKIQTIDSLCGTLTRQMPLMSNFGAQPLIDDAPQLSYQQAVHNVLKKLESDSSTADALEMLLAHIDNDVGRAERLMMTLLERRDQWLLHIVFGGYEESVRAALETTLQRVVEDNLSRLKNTLQVYAGDLLPLLDYAGINLQAEHADSPASQLAGIAALPGIAPSSVPKWKAIAEALLTAKHEWRKTVTVKNGFPAQTKAGDKAESKEKKQRFLALISELKAEPGLLESLVELRHLPAVTYPEKQWQLLSALTCLLPELVAELMLVFQQRGVVDYAQIAMAAMQALGDGLNPSELALKLDHRLSHILIDEFQDTSTPQFELLCRLVEGWQEYNQENPERPNTLFIVGDGMQSIYGFREANVGLFLQARKQGVNGLRLQDLSLSVNFRSVPAVVDWVNATFSSAFPSVDNIARGAVAYEQSKSFKAVNDDSGVDVSGFFGETGEQDEAEYIAQQIVQRQGIAPDESIAILVRSRNHLRDIIPALNRAGVAWNATDIDPLLQYAPVMDLLTLTRALLNIADRVAWAGLLRSPLCGLNNADMHALLAYDERQSLWAVLLDDESLSRISRGGRELLLRLRNVIRPAFLHRQRKSLRVWLEGIWLSLGGVAVLDRAEDYPMIEDYFDLLASYQHKTGGFSLENFQTAVEKLYAVPRVEDARLHIMTIHKSKGLEFDTVILPALGRGSRSNDKALLMWNEHISESGEKGLLLSPLGAHGEDDDAIYQHLRFEQSQAEVLENTRLLYVAATRAVKRLLLTFTADIDKKTDQFKSPGKRSLLHCIWPAIDGQIIRKESVVNQLDFSVEDDVAERSKVEQAKALQRLAANWKAPAVKAVNPLQAYYPPADFDNSEIAVAVEDDGARIIGTVVHLALEHLANVDASFWLAMTESSRQNWLTGLLNYQQVPRQRQADLLLEIERAVKNTVSDTKGRWLLSQQSQAAAEQLILHNTTFGVRQFIVDRTFVDEQGTRWIIDYKTGQPHVGESKEVFVEREVAAYRDQLARYQQLYTALGEESIRTALYFTHYPHWQEVGCVPE